MKTEVFLDQVGQPCTTQTALATNRHLNQSCPTWRETCSPLVYTSFDGMGFRLLASAQVPTEIQQVFIERVAYQHWDSYDPPKSGYRAVYLYQVTPEHSLFGWLYNDGADDMDRCHVPYFMCYYLAGPLHAVQLENIFTCLQKGPVALIDRHNIPATLDNIVLRNFWSYQPTRPGVAIALDVRRHSHIALNQGELLDLFGDPVNSHLAPGHIDVQPMAFS